MHNTPSADRPTTTKRRDIMRADLPGAASTKFDNSSLVKTIKPIDRRKDLRELLCREDMRLDGRNTLHVRFCTENEGG
jgi:hypothetical protein